MKEIPLTSIVGWSKTGTLFYPASIDVNCPACQRLTNMRTDGHQPNTKYNFVVARARCPACGSPVTVWAVHCLKRNQGKVAIDPDPAQPLQANPSSNLAPDRIQRAYVEALQTYNNKIWNATLTSCRRTLEGIVKHQIPQDRRRGSLFQQLEDLPKHVSLDVPLIDLTHAIRAGGNLGAHFDDERDADEEVARTAIELIEFFIEYLYVLPQQVRDLRMQLDKIDAQEDDQQVGDST